MLNMITKKNCTFTGIMYKTEGCSNVQIHY